MENKNITACELCVFGSGVHADHCYEKERLRLLEAQYGAMQKLAARRFHELWTRPKQNCCEGCVFGTANHADWCGTGKQEYDPIIRALKGPWGKTKLGPVEFYNAKDSISPEE